MNERDTLNKHSFDNWQAKTQQERDDLTALLTAVIEAFIAVAGCPAITEIVEYSCPEEPSE